MSQSALQARRKKPWWREASTIVGGVLFAAVVGSWTWYAHRVGFFGAFPSGAIGPAAGDNFDNRFAALVALFNALAFGGVIVTILLQREELKAQREELAATRAEFRDQNETMKLQRFENTFFSMLRLYHDIVSAAEYKAPGVDLRGRAVFALMARDLLVRMDQGPVDLRSVYGQFLRQYRENLEHYYETLLQVLVRVDESELESRSDYADIVRAQLSMWEVLLLFYHTMTADDDRWRVLVIGYKLLDGVPVERLPLPHRTLVAKVANPKGPNAV